MHMHYLGKMGTTTISLSDEAYKILRAQKRGGESFSDLILRTFGRGNPAAILAFLKDKGSNSDLADAVEKVIKDFSQNSKLEEVKT